MKLADIPRTPEHGRNADPFGANYSWETVLNGLKEVDD